MLRWQADQLGNALITRRIKAEIQPRYSRDTAEIQPRYSLTLPLITRRVQAGGEFISSVN